VPGFPGVPTTFTSVVNPLLAADTRYWFVITAVKADEPAWYENDQGVLGGVWAGLSLDGLINFEAGTAAPAIRLNTIDSVSVPEAANSGVLLGGAVLLLAALGTRLRPAPMRAGAARWVPTSGGDHASPDPPLRLG